MDALGQALGRSLQNGAVVYLRGQLGTGKTTLVRGVLKGLGFDGRVRSPTYTLVEGYEIGGHQLYHLDLYRIRGPEEMEYLGARDLDDPDLWVFAEWPEHGEGRLPEPDLVLNFELRESGRSIRAESQTGRGEQLTRAWLARLRTIPGTGGEPEAAEL
ncbi:MAG: tRNA (adenosine(37)-N6)-threonylcarbamoyltransferase complex ATPase subunit type 1 TsaE [Gammaproteobacteria bacterium]|nr:tRNA (adenosine(37)-N6)-threonylcarbamoyltransferase complex ATPase subunit type 1 TsaE [Gammaproteobacteria bacterium]